MGDCAGERLSSAELRRKSVTDDDRSERTAGLTGFESARGNPSVDAAPELSDFLAAKSGGRIDLTRTKVSDTNLQLLRLTSPTVLN